MVSFNAPGTPQKSRIFLTSKAMAATSMVRGSSADSTVDLFAAMANPARVDMTRPRSVPLGNFAAVPESSTGGSATSSAPSEQSASTPSSGSWPP